MVLVIFACINPWVRKRMITGRMKAFRAIKEPMRIGFFAFFSVRTSTTKVISAIVNTSRNGVDDQPKFCPKDGMHLPADRVSEWSLTKSGGGKVRFFDKAQAIALARAIGVFDSDEGGDTEDLSDEALFGALESDL